MKLNKENINYYGVLFGVLVLILLLTIGNHSILEKYEPQEDWYGSLFLGIGLAAVIGFILSFISRVFFLIFSIKTTATITTVKESIASFKKLSEVYRGTENPIHDMFIEEKDIVYSYKFVFEANDGKRYFINSDRVQTTEKISENEQRNILYLKWNPNKAILDTFFTKWSWSLFFLIFSLTFCTIGGLMVTGNLK